MNGGFVYFVPGAGLGLTPKQIVEHGLTYAFERSPCASNAGTPGGEAGAIMSAESDLFDLIRTDELQWRKLPGGSVQVAMVGEPTPDDLVRREVIDGDQVQLGRHNWIIPVVRTFTKRTDNDRWILGTMLPRALTIGDDGEWYAGDVLAEHRKVYKAASDWLSRAIESESGPPVDGDTAVLGIQTNYRVGAAELSLLGVLSTDAVVRVCKAMVRWDMMLDAQSKKNDSETGSTTSDGPGDLTPDTPPAS